MRSLLIACVALAAFVAASSRNGSPLNFRQPLEAKREYRFTYEGVLSSGLPIETDGAVSRISSEVTVQMVDDRTIHMKLSNIRVAASHVRPEQLKQQQKLSAPADMLEEREIDDVYRRMLETPVRATYRQGQISEVQFEEKDDAWCKNVKRAILNMLQMNMDKSTRRQTTESMEEKTTETEQYSVPEKTIEGDCETTYTVSREGDERVVVTKAIHFDKCLNTDGTQVAYGQRFESECEQCEKQSQIVNPSTLYTYVIEGKQLKSVEVRSVYQVTLKDQPMMKTETSGRLVLTKEQPLSTPLSTKDLGAKEDLIYSNEWEEIVERFFKNGEKEEKYPFERFETEMKIKQIKRIADQLTKTEDNKAETSHDLARLVLLQRMLSEKELGKQHNEIYEKAEQKTQDILEHSLAIAGTYNTIKHLIHHIENEDVTPVKAAQLLKQIAETPFPSERIVELIIRLVKSPIAKKSPMLRQSCWLAAGAVMRGVVAETKDRMLVDEKSKDIKEKFISHITKEFESAESTYEKILALKTFANAGIDLSVYTLTKIINDREEKLAVRIEAVEALRLLKDTMPRKIQQILLPIYKNRKQPADLRMACLVRIMHTLPNADLLAQIGHHIDQESNKQVALFTYRLISEIATSTNPCYKQLSVLCQQVLSNVRYTPSTSEMQTTFVHLPYFSENTLSGVQLNLASVFGSDSSLPKALSASVDSLFAGNWHRYMAQLGFSQQNIDTLIEKVLRKLENSPSTLVRGQRGQKTVTILKELAKKLNIRERETRSTQEPHAVFYMRYKEMDYVMLPVDEKIVDELAEMLISNGRITPEQLARVLNRQHKFTGHVGAFFFESIRKMPTTIGLPLTISGKAPTVMSVDGEVEIKLLPLGVRMTLKAQPTIATTHVVTMKVWTPILEQGIKVLTTLEMNTPIDFEIEASLKNQLEITYKTAGNDEELTVRASRRPVAFMRFNKGNRRDYTEPEQRTLSHPFESQLLREVDYTYEMPTGLTTRVNGAVLANWEQADAALFCEQHIEIVCTGRNPITGKLVVEQYERARIESPVESREMFAEEFADNYKRSSEYESSSEETDNYTPRDEKKRREHFEKRVSEWKKESSQGYKHRMTARVESKGQYAEMTVRTECDEKINYCRVSVDARRPALFEDERSEWTMKTKTAVFLPHMPTTISELEEQEHREIQAIVNAEWGSSKKSEATLKVQLGQSPMQNKWLRVYKKINEKSGMSAYETLVKAARLNELKAVVEYEQMTPSTLVYMQRAFELFKAANIFSTSRWEIKETEEKQRPSGRLFLRATVEPVTRRYMNVSIETEQERLEWQSLSLPFRMALPSIARASMRQQYSGMGTSECRVQVDRVSTFDAVPYRVPLTTCYSVVAKDCSSLEQPRFAVLAKKLNKRSEKIALKIVNENGDELEFYPEEEKESKPMRMLINGKAVRDEEKLNEFGVETISTEVIRVKLSDIEVRFDGYTVKTHISRRYNNKQCGLCGHYDGEETNEFRMADNTETEDLEEFHRSFLVKGMKGEECEIEEEHISNKDNYKTYEKEFYGKDLEQEDEEESYEQPEEYTYSKNKKYNKKYGKKQSETSEENTVEPVKKTRVVEFSHRVCFSKDPVMECPRGTQADETVDTKVQFTCLARQQKDARKLLKQAREGKQLRLADFPVTYVESVALPKTCEVY